MRRYRLLYLDCHYTTPSRDEPLHGHASWQERASAAGSPMFPPQIYSYRPNFMHLMRSRRCRDSRPSQAPMPLLAMATFTYLPDTLRGPGGHPRPRHTQREVCMSRELASENCQI